MSHGGDEDDLAAQAWPGFVDILSSVLIMFVFFLMLTAVALAFHTAMFKSKVKAEMAAQSVESAQKIVKSTQAELLAENKKLKEELEAQKAALVQAKLDPGAKQGQVIPPLAPDAANTADQVQKEAQRELETKLDVMQQAAVLAESKDQKVEISENSLVLYYGPDSISVTPEVSVKINVFLKKFDPNQIKVTIVANRNTSNAMEEMARRVAVARMLNLRNLVIAYKVPPSAIVGSIIEGDKMNDQFDWATLKVEAK